MKLRYPLLRAACYAKLIVCIAALGAANIVIRANANQAVAEDDEKLKHTADSLERVKELVDKEEAILVDVRDLVEWDAGHVQGAVALPWRDLQGKLKEDEVRKKLPEKKIIYTYCVVGYRSLKAGEVLRKYNYDVRPLKKGYDDLINAGFINEKETKK